MAWIILLILIGGPIAEIWVLIEIGGVIGAIPTIALIVATAVLGTLLFRVQGMATLARVRAHLDRNEMPVGELLSGLGLLLAGILLLVPGFVTDAIGLLLFIPPLRRSLITLLLAWALARGVSLHRMRTDAGPGPEMRGGPTIDGDFTEVSDEDRPPEDPEPSSRLNPPNPPR